MKRQDKKELVKTFTIVLKRRKGLTWWITRGLASNP
jgi:hypothetical protein